MARGKGNRKAGASSSQAHIARTKGDDDAQDSEVKPSAFDLAISQAVWKLLQPILQGTVYAAEKDAPLLKADVEDFKEIGDFTMSGRIRDRIEVAYAELDRSELYKVWWRDAKSFVEAVKIAISVTLRSQYQAFNVEYVTGPEKEFEDYLNRCCNEYFLSPHKVKAPYATIIQSSGFGKSRLLFQLAKGFVKMTLPQSTLQQGTEKLSFDMRLLYLKAPSDKTSTWIPRTTPQLYNFFFGTPSEGAISSQIERAFEIALSKWETIQTEWLSAFETYDGLADINITKALNTRIDKPPQKKARVSGKSSSSVTSQRNAVSKRVKVLVLAIDEAQVLLQKEATGSNNLELLHRALRDTNARLESKKQMVFGVLVATNSRIYDFVDSTAQYDLDHSSKKTDSNPSLLFPPFVLTGTMDAMLPKPFDCKASVLTDDGEAAWSTLLKMGRPYWHAFYTAAHDESETPLTKTEMILFGGAKLLCGMPMTLEKSYRADTLGGVASLLCRLGLRPQSSSAFATRAVADFLATLHYVNYTNDAHISGYVTEPLLAFAATHIWYALGKAALRQHILPQFAELLMQGVVDIGGIGEVVARIFLLLAMDKTIAGNDMDLFSYQQKQFTGQWRSVTTFLDELEGIRESKVSDTSIEGIQTSDEKQKTETSETTQEDIPPLKYLTCTMSAPLEKAENTGNAESAKLAGSAVTIEIPKRSQRVKPGRIADSSKSANTDVSYEFDEISEESKDDDSDEDYEDDEKDQEDDGNEESAVKRKVYITPATDDDIKRCKQWKDGWKDWELNFSHFVELKEVPTTDSLWFLLSRRAAGVFPRGQPGSDLIIPIFHKSRRAVSFILVQVKNRESVDNSFPTPHFRS